MAQHFRPAGIFSTDDPGSDQMQIEAEQGPWDEGDLVYLEDDCPVETILRAGCRECGWWDVVYYPEGDKEALELAKRELRHGHRMDSLSCGNEISFV